MERHTVIVANNILSKIEETERVLKFICEMEGEPFVVRRKDCPYQIPIPTITLQNEIYLLIKKCYEDELNDLKNRLKAL